MKTYSNKPFALLGIHVGGSNVKQLKAIVEYEKLTWRSFVDEGNAGAGPIATQWNHTATPSFYILDHQGIIRHKWTGAPGEKLLDTALEKLIQAAEQK